MNLKKSKTSTPVKVDGQKPADRQKQTIDRLVCELDIAILQLHDLQEDFDKYKIATKVIVKQNDEYHKYANETGYRNEQLVKENITLKDELRRWRRSELHHNDTLHAVIKNQHIIHNLVKNIYGAQD